MRHTKGIWQVRENGNKSDGDYLEVFAPPQNLKNSHLNVICRLFNNQYDADNKDTCNYSQGRKNQEANAKLISAAPKLLETLEYLIDQLEDGYPKRADIAWAKVVIEKAKGEQ